MTLLKAKTTNLPAFKAVLWDMDGTLVDSEPLITRAAIKAHDELGYPLSKELFDSTVGIGYEGTFEIIKKALNMPVTYAQWSERLMANHVAMAEQNIQPRKNTVDIVKHLHARGVRQAIVSASPGPVVRASVTGFLRHFDASMKIFDLIISADDVIETKPDPEGYLYAAEKLGVSPAECIVIEDSPTGTKAGMNAGMFTIFWPAMTFDNPPNASAIVETLDFILEK